KPQDHCSTKDPEGSGNLNPTASTSNPPVDQMETLTMETLIPTVSSPVPTAYFNDSQEPSSDARLISKRVANQVETPSLDNILSLTNRFEDILGVTTNSDESNGVEADISNMKTAITASPTPTLRIHKDHPKSQIIGLMDTPIQTRNKSKELCREFEALMHEKFQMSAMGELNFFLGLQVLQKEDGIFLLQDKLSMPCEALSKEFLISILRLLILLGEGSGTLTEPHHIPSPEALSPSHTTHTSPTLPPVTITSISTVTQSDTPIVRQYTRRTRIAQSSVPLTVADEPASPLRDVSQGEAYPTDSGFIADQDMATIDKSSTLPHDSAPQVTSPVSDEGTQEVEINRLKERVKMLEDREGVAATRSEDDAPIKGKSMDEEEAATERINDDSKEMATVLTSMDETTVLASGVVDVPTGSGSIPTASTHAKEHVPTGSDVVPTASLVFATATVVSRELEEKLEREDQRRSEQIARDAKIARIHAEEELQIMIDGLDRNNETVAKYMQEYHQFASELPIERRIELITDLVNYQDNYANIYKYQSQQRKPMTKKQKRDYYMAVIKNNLGWKVKDFRGMTFEEVEAKFNSVWKQMEDFILMGSKEEAERIKRKCLNLEQESVKKQKTSEEVPKEAMSPEEVPEENVKEMMQLVPIKEVYVEALQVKHPIIDWKVYTEGQRSC
nr:putative ribonuclease H-like domain-containing protein [Tanacetum cinerariifolium]GEZ43539.1 putative ribonuclease H-like domain-containing protein [Tanacetum cinerariifolium]